MALADPPTIPPQPAGGGTGGGRLAENVLHFARVLRAAGLPVGPGKTLDAVRAAAKPHAASGAGRLAVAVLHVAAGLDHQRRGAELQHLGLLEEVHVDAHLPILGLGRRGREGVMGRGG